MAKPRAILTFDLEFWYNALSLEKDLIKERLKNTVFEDRIPQAVEPILNLLKKYNIRATFFVLGQLAEKYPDLIKKIYDLGHEIASHGYSHKPLFKLSEENFKKEVETSKNILKKITGEDPRGFRMPNCSLTNREVWSLKILSENGFEYDSSVFPMRTPLYGIKNGITTPYRISLFDTSKIDKNSPILELPIAVYQAGNSKIRLPVGGGCYFRIMPLFIYLNLLKSVAKKMVPITYFHPYDLDNYIPKTTSVNWFKKKLKFYGVTKDKNFKKFNKLIACFDFISVRQFIEENRSSLP